MRPIAFEDLDRREWAQLEGQTRGATPFSRWTFHRAWWDAYSGTADPLYLVAGEEPLAAIVPLMARSEPAGALPTYYYAASYHADYATALMAPEDATAVASALVDELTHRFGTGIAAGLDLRRIREGDAFADALTGVAEAVSGELGWRFRREQEDVCPVVPLSTDWNDLLGRLGKKQRHEIRRKIRRAQDAGPIRLGYLPLDSGAVGSFIRLHQARWGSRGLFAPGEDGDRGRRFLHRLAELESQEGDQAQFHIGEVVIGDRVAYVLAGFSADRRTFFYNAGLDPAMRDLSPGVVGTAAYLRDRAEAGDTAFDFLRGNESYKYDWGAVDTSIDRITIEPSGQA